MNPQEISLFQKTNKLFKNLFEGILKIDKDNKNLKDLIAKENIINYDIYKSKYIFFIPEFFIYYVEENLKGIKIFEESKELENEKNIFSLIETISNSDLQFELSEQKVNEFEIFQCKKNEENKCIIEKLILEINELSFSNDNLLKENNLQEKEFINKKEEILLKFSKLKNENLKEIDLKVKEIQRNIRIRNDNHNELFFDDFYKFKENFEKAFVLYEEKNEINDFEMFSFDFLTNYIEKYTINVNIKLENSKKKLFEFVDQRLCSLNKDAINSKNEIKLKLEKKEIINKKLYEDICKLQKEEKALIEKIRLEKDNFLIQRNNLPGTTIYIEFKNGFYDYRILLIVYFSLFLLGFLFFS
jgi:hypothetical protein